LAEHTVRIGTPREVMQARLLPRSSSRGDCSIFVTPQKSANVLIGDKGNECFKRLF
jgi:hypothetical protein